MKTNEIQNTTEHTVRKLGESFDSIVLNWATYWNKCASASLGMPLMWWRMIPHPKPPGEELRMRQPVKEPLTRPPEQPGSRGTVERPEEQKEAHHAAEVSSEMAKRSRRIADLQRRTKAELYEYAKERGIEHRSQMSKSELVAALVDLRKS